MSLRRKRTLLSLCILFSILSLYSTFDYFYYLQDREEKSLRTGEETLSQIQEEFNETLTSVIDKAEEIKNILQSSNFGEDELVSMISNESRNIYHLHGITVAYQPYAFNDQIRLYSPFYDKRKGRITNLESIYDYTVDSVESNQWYTGPLKNLKGTWSEPYFATSAELVVADYGIPFYVNGRDQPSGVISMTLDLKKLGAKIDSLSVGRTGTSMIISQTGKVVAHPIPEYVLDVDLNSIAKDLRLEKQVSQIMSNQTGHVTFKRMTGQSAHAFYSNIPRVDWKTIITFNSDDLLGSADLLYKKLVKISLSISLLILTLLFYLLNIEFKSAKKLWYLSAATSLIIVANIIVMWYLNLNYNYSSFGKNEVMISNRSGLRSFVNSENTKIEKLGLQRFIPVPTGIFIEEFQFVDSYSVNVRGEVWQKWPIHLAKFYEAGIRFPQEAQSGKTSIIKKNIEEDKKFITHTWSFKIRLKMPFDYSKYPFDVRDLKIEIMYPDVKSGILLVPDVDGYTGLSPFDSPGINKYIYFNDTKLISTHFSFDIVDYKERFGNKKFTGLNKFPIMTYTVNLKRRLLNVLVMNIIPILVVASMIFLIFYSNTKNKEDKSGVSMMGVIQSCAGFFFVLLVAHIDLRRRLSTPTLTYIESFYLTMYVIMALLAINVVAFTKTEKYRFVSYRDNLLVKIAYWPALLFAWLIITLLVFYS